MMHKVHCTNCGKQWETEGHTPCSWAGGWVCSRSCDIENCIRRLDLDENDIEHTAWLEGVARDEVRRNWGEELQFTIHQRKQSYYGLPFEGFTVVDKHGVYIGDNVYLAVIRRESDKQLFGVPWRDEGDWIDVGGYSKEDINVALPVIALWLVIGVGTVYCGGIQNPLSELDLPI